MSRPEFITEEHLVRWSKILEDEQVQGSEQFKEILFAGLWLAEELEKLKCPKDLIVRIQYTTGRLCFREEPWTVHQAMLEAYKNNQLEFEIDYDA